ncbi:hypothetical protein [Asticcacaulis taihuensis]|uniref:hypothetical protein n=1 Tax=Asticcacaulis taihuensis TaxID=260084 RepID=UPI0026EAF16B|nr:hypothetical protein [Asticcacaulis taihuensis]
MSETPKLPKRKLTQAEMRAARLQAALRDNLRRRKAAAATTDEQPDADNEKGKQNES